jgi:hypothetical protein
VVRTCRFFERLQRAAGGGDADGECRGECA